MRYLSLADGLAADPGAKKLSPVEYTKALLDRIAAVDPSYNAFLLVTADIALAQAKAAEAEIAAGRWRGPMHGIPYAAKDIIDIEGMATTCHSKVRIGHHAASDAFVIRKLREAGAMLLGKLALHEFATGGPAFDLPWPPARNPWNRDLHPGGSSSGSGAALAAGLAPATLGTDTGGSVRNPATCCGIVGLKPTYGAVSPVRRVPADLLARPRRSDDAHRRGQRDPVPRHRRARSRRSDQHAARGRRLPDGPRTRGLKGLRIGVIEHFYTDDSPGNPEQVRGIERGDRRAAPARRRGAARSSCRRCRPGPTATAPSIRPKSYAIHERDMQERPEDYAALTRSKTLPGAFISASKYIKAQQLRRVLCQEFADAMRDLDAVVTLSSLDMPAHIEDPAEVARTYDRQCRLVFNVTGTPAISVPTGISADGLPLAMQIASRAFDEAMIYRVAQAYCEAAGTSIGTDMPRRSRGWSRAAGRRGGIAAATAPRGRAA